MEIVSLIQKEIALEIRRKSIISGLLLYLFSTVFLTYLTFRGNLMSPLAWSAMYWIILLFTTVNVIAKSFIGERPGRYIYYYSIASPSAIILSKILYNFLLCLFVSIFCFLLFILLLGNPIVDLTLFGEVVLLASLGFSTSLTIISGIASRTTSGHVLMAVLSFPVIISILVIAVKLTKNCIDGLDPSVSTNDLLILVAINCIVTAVSYLLFPYIWRS